MCTHIYLQQLNMEIKSMINYIEQTNFEGQLKIQLDTNLIQ